MPTLVTTLSSETANSYVNVAYCDTYWAEHYATLKATAWAALTSTQKASALFHACRSLEALRFTTPLDRYVAPPLRYDNRNGLVMTMPYSGDACKADSNQALQFPRNLDINTSGVYSIPDAIMAAQCEQALYLITFDEESAAATLRGLDYESVTVGQVSTTQRFTGGITANVATLRLSPVAVEMVSPYLIRSNKLQRG